MSGTVAVTGTREQRRTRRRRLRLMVRYFVIGFVMAVLGGHALGAVVALLRIKVVTVLSSDLTVAEEVKEQIKIPPGSNLLTSRVTDFARQAEACPRVARVEVERKLPDRLVLTVHPRVPVLAWEKDGRYLLVDKEGVCLYWTDRPGDELLRVKGVTLDACVGQQIAGDWFQRSCVVAEALEGADSFRPWTLDASYPPELSLITAGGARGIMGTKGAADRRARLFAEVLAEYEAQGKAVGLAELRTDPPIVWLEGKRPDRLGAGPAAPAAEASGTQE